MMARFTGREPFATVDGLRMAKHHMFFTAAKAERDLGFRARPYREALADAMKEETGKPPRRVVKVAGATSIEGLKLTGEYRDDEEDPDDED